MSLSLIPLIGFPLIQPGDDLPVAILASLNEMGIDLDGGDILVIAQKVVSKAENRLVNLTTVTPSNRAIELAKQTEKDPRLLELILQESNGILRSRPGLVIVEHHLGFVCANAGIDHSNVKGSWGEHKDWVLLLPENPDQSARVIRKKLVEQTGLNLGVMVIDSHGRAWRRGTVGVCIGLSGIPGVVDLRGSKDLFDYELVATEVGAADELAAAASLVMGQAGEGTPAVHVRGFPYPLQDGELAEILRPKDKDEFR
jgi:coenzyme F420-0:L-glutamate ligase/coenzyme F420-1:gamma-L-glutamate ligase